MNAHVIHAHPMQQRSLVSGLALAVGIALVARWLGHLLPLVGSPVIGIVLGIIVGNLTSPGERFRPGIAFAGKYVLQWSIIALGFGLSLSQVARTGLQSLSVTVVTMTVAFLSAWLLGRWLGVHDKLKILIGVGTAICGGSAIAAITPIIRPEDHDTAFAISTIFLFNLVAVLLFPLLGHLMHLSDLGFGLWAGTAINDTSSVVAAGYSYSKTAGDFATIVKLTRATLIIPVCLVLAFAVAAREKRKAAKDGSAGNFSLAKIRCYPAGHSRGSGISDHRRAHRHWAIRQSAPHGCQRRAADFAGARCLGRGSRQQLAGAAGDWAALRPSRAIYLNDVG